MRAVFGCVILAAALLLAGCATDEDRAPSIGDAYIGPATLNLRKEIDPKSSTVAVAHHGDHVEIVGRRRLWYRVRTDKGIEGWTEDRQLLDKAQMLRIRKFSQETAGLPSQGKATTYDLLNVHSEPSRTSTSFVQVKEKEVFDVIAHRVTARNTKQPKRELTHPTPKATAPPKKAKKDAVPPPPAPTAPAPPVDWIALSKERGVDADADTPPVAQDDWSLIRTASGQSGWVLTSRVYMLIPDEVAQYAEGHRIVSYASIGKIDDNGELKDIWLWTTIESLGQDYDFDSYRVFVWSLRHHRYETAYIQRRERGYLPVLAKEGWFSVCVEDKNGDRIRRDYTMTGNTVRPAGVRACEVKPLKSTDDLNALPVAAPAPKPPAEKSVTEKLKAKWRQWFSKSTKK
ncbi:MAG TPA: SH3 domain-containing protein [Bryobacteraceae bacterium]|nr:SH3 domain-containing protein [Bryobacteraceae bacterium]